jgi:ATP-binding cassette subfamily B protein
MNYNLNDVSLKQEKVSSLKALRKLLQLISEERNNLLLAVGAILINSGINLSGPFIVGHVIDKYVVPKDFHGVKLWAGILLGMYLIGFVASYMQSRMMGGVGSTDVV